MAAFSEIDPNWRKYKGVVLCGTHTPKEWEKQIKVIEKARKDGTPLYGECFGHQLVAIEYARNIMGITQATSEEFGKGVFVVKKLPKLNVGLKNGESFWNNYEVCIPLRSPENFFTTQSHPSYQSAKGNPNPLIISFLRYARMVS